MANIAPQVAIFFQAVLLRIVLLIALNKMAFHPLAEDIFLESVGNRVQRQTTIMGMVRMEGLQAQLWTGRPF